MTKKRREFTPEFEREAVALLESSGRPQMQIAAELGIQPSMLRNWRAVLNGGAPRSRPSATAAPVAPSPVASPADQAAEIARLRRELDRTRMERDVLKKAIGIFAEGRTGCCYDNAPMESFFHTLKIELVHQQRWGTREDAKRGLFAYIEGYSNRQRLHSALGYLTPEQAERRELTPCPRKRGRITAGRPC